MMVFKELFDPHALSCILNNRAEHEPYLIKDETEVFKSTASKDFLVKRGLMSPNEDFNYFLQAERYLDVSKSGQNITIYNHAFSATDGRLFARKGLSLINLPVGIRNAIACDIYDDIDMVNAHPTIIRAVCMENNIKCRYLSDYIEKRDLRLQELMDANKKTKMSRGVAKQIFLAVLNGGKKDYKKCNPTIFLKKYKKELDNILIEFSKLYSEEFEKRKLTKALNAEGSLVNFVACCKENAILMFIVDFFKKEGIITKDEDGHYIAVLCFDGIMVLKNDRTALLLPRLEREIKQKFGFRLKLKMKPMEQILHLPDEIPEYVEPQPFDPNDSFVWLDFVKKYNDQHYDSLFDAFVDMRVDLERVYARSEGGQGLHIRKTDCKDNMYDMTLGNLKSACYIWVKQGKKKQTEVRVSMNKLLESFTSKIPVYSFVGCDPSCSNPNMFNMWKGFVAKPIKLTKKNIKKIKPIQKLLKKVYCNNDKKLYKYFLTLLHSMLKYPDKPLEVATFIFSKGQGSGKNTFLEFFKNHVIGTRTSFQGSNLDCLTGKFNNHLMHKKMVIVEEASSCTEGSFKSAFDKAKSMITATTISVEKKGFDAINVPNILALFLLSNHPDALFLEETDRRYLCLWVNSMYIGNKAFWDTVYACFTDEIGSIFYSYILEWGKKNKLHARSHIDIYSTDFKQEIIAQSASSSRLFLDHLYHYRVTYREEELFRNKKSYLIRSGELYAEYEAWCKQNGERVKKARSFLIDLKDIIDKKHLNDGNFYDLDSYKPLQKNLIEFEENGGDPV